MSTSLWSREAWKGGRPRGWRLCTSQILQPFIPLPLGSPGAPASKREVLGDGSEHTSPRELFDVLDHEMKAKYRNERACLLPRFFWCCSLGALLHLGKECVKKTGIPSERKTQPLYSLLTPGPASYWLQTKGPWGPKSFPEESATTWPQWCAHKSSCWSRWLGRRSPFSTVLDHPPTLSWVAKTGDWKGP